MKGLISPGVIYIKDIKAAGNVNNDGRRLCHSHLLDQSMTRLINVKACTLHITDSISSMFLFTYLLNNEEYH